MSTLTPNLGLFKYDVTNDSQTAFSITNALNNNWDKIDTAWTNIDALPDQTDKAGYLLTTNGSEASWGETTDVKCVVETYENSTSGYRLWSDGWCEQWGRASLANRQSVNVYFLIPFVDTNYTLKAVNTDNSTDNDTKGGGVQFTPTALAYGNLSSHQLARTVTVSWQACGYTEV